MVTVPSRLNGPNIIYGRKVKNTFKGKKSSPFQDCLHTSAMAPFSYCDQLHRTISVHILIDETDNLIRPVIMSSSFTDNYS